MTRSRASPRGLIRIAVGCGLARLDVGAHQAREYGMKQANWTAGYVADIDYTYGYYEELNPARLRLACLSGGFAAPTGTHPAYLELGFGQGISVNVHAAANEGDFWGTDFNPAHTAHAQALAAAAGSDATLLNDSFAELAARTDLPEFDIIGLHGIWSWISDENRQSLVEIIRRKLKVGGIVYISYNCFPGWAPAMPLRHLMTLHAELAGSEASGIVGKVDGALKFAQQVVDSGARYFQANPAVAERLKRISGQNRRYLAHEYFNLDWDVMAFSDVARLLAHAKVSFAASAHLLDHVELINLSERARELLSGIKQPLLYQSVRDYFVNQQFRRDVFIKGARELTPLERLEALQRQSFVLVINPDAINFKVKGSLGEAELQERIYRPVVEVLAEDSFSPKPFAQIAAHPKLKMLKFPELLQIILVLTGAGHLHPAQESTPGTKAACAALNKYLCGRSRSSNAISVLASSVTGSGIAVGRFQQLFLTAMQAGAKAPADQAARVWSLLLAQGQRLAVEEKTLETADENVAELKRQATEFAEKRLPTLKALGIC
jgi:SAM-dependent methyltransferase